MGWRWETIEAGGKKKKLIIGNRLLSINTNQWTEAKTGNQFPGAGSMSVKMASMIHCILPATAGHENRAQ